MIKSTGHADLPLHGGTVPRWLSDRMMALGSMIIESLVYQIGRKEVLVRLSDPLWFQSLGAVLGMDWHSSGITTSVLYALKRGLNPRAGDLGIYICGGRGKYSRRTPDELLALAGSTGLDGDSLVRASRLCAKIDSAAVQDGFQLYQHNFILTKEGDWAVIQQGMNPALKAARRYHWCSANLRSFSDEPHTAVVGENRGSILNLTAAAARETRGRITEIARENPDRILREFRGMTGADFANAAPFCGPENAGGVVSVGGAAADGSRRGGAQPDGGADGLSAARDAAAAAPQKKAAEAFTARADGQGCLFPELFAPAPPSAENGGGNAACGVVAAGRNMAMPAHHDVRAEDVDLKRLGAVLATAYESNPQDFDSLVLTPGLGPRTLQSLALVSEVMYGTPSRFTDPARFSFAHGGKDGHPFPVPLKIYDESIRILHESIERSRLGYRDKSDCIRRLHATALRIERQCEPSADFRAAVEHEREASREWGGRTVFDGE